MALQVTREPILSDLNSLMASILFLEFDPRMMTTELYKGEITNFFGYFWVGFNFPQRWHFDR